MTKEEAIKCLRNTSYWLLGCITKDTDIDWDKFHALEEQFDMCLDVLTEEGENR